MKSAHGKVRAETVGGDVLVVELIGVGRDELRKRLIGIPGRATEDSIRA
jgi:hypothetical protein